LKPPYTITPEIFDLVRSISERIGALKARHHDRANPQLRKSNRIRTIHASLQIEGNELSERQITLLLDGKRLAGPEKDIREATNAIAVYNDLPNYRHGSEADYLRAHAALMQGLVSDPGKYRKKEVGVAKGSVVEHLAPPATNVPHLMRDLFNYLNNERELTLIKSCVFHYESEFIHPFTDGNGRMGRLWQTVILASEYPVFEHLPIETLIRQTQADYYSALSRSDKMGQSTPFIEYMLTMIDRALAELDAGQSETMDASARLQYFLEQNESEFSRKDYMAVFPRLSSATASRDLLAGVERGLLRRVGVRNSTKYVRC
jgi:Fic family protein